MKIETERLIITRFDLSMAESVHQNSLDEDMRRFLPDEVFETVEEARSTLEFLIGRYEGEEGPLVYPVLLKDGTNIGYVQLAGLAGGWEIGYHIAQKYTGYGYASEAAKAFLKRICAKLQIREVMGVCDAGNAASVKVLEKCGFEKVYEGDGIYQGKKRRICRYRYEA